MSYTILTTIMGYTDGKTTQTELPFAKTFTTEKEAKEYGERFFEPAGTVIEWRVTEKPVRNAATR